MKRLSYPAEFKAEAVRQLYFAPGGQVRHI